MKNIDSRIHIFGAGISGLATAVYCQIYGLNVNIYEATAQAGGRCRSFYDSKIGKIIDNGNHLVLGGNNNIFEFLKAVGASQKLQPAPRSFTFIDLKSDEKWSFNPGNPKVPLWLLSPKRRIPGTTLLDYLKVRKIVKNPTNTTLSNHVDPNSTMFERFWNPLCSSVLNTSANEGSAKLLGEMLKLTFFRNTECARPFLVPDCLSATFVDPPIKYLQKKGSNIAYGTRLKSISLNQERVYSAECRKQQIEIRKNDHIVLALPPTELKRLVPGIQVPLISRPILNIHFKLNDAIPLPDNAPFIGLINGISQWIFQRENTLSVTVSNATDFIDLNSFTLAKNIWSEVSRITNIKTTPLPPHRVIKERQATIAQTPQQELLRPDSATRWKNLHIAGDWTNTGLPATIEGAIKSAKNVTNNILKII